MKNLDYQMIGLKIKEKRKQKKLTQQQLADLIYKTESSIRKYEKGLVEIPNSVLLQIANVLNIELFDLIGYDKTMSEVSSEINVLSKIIPSSEEDKIYLEKRITDLKEKYIKSNINISESEKIVYEKKTQAILMNLPYLNITGYQLALDYIVSLSKYPEFRR